MTRRRLWASLLGCVGITVLLLLLNLAFRNTPVLGLDLQGGVSVVLSPTEGATGDDLLVIRDLIRDELENRGIAEPDVRVEGSNIVVDLPGVKDQREALDAVDVAGIVTLRPVFACAAAAGRQQLDDLDRRRSSTTPGSTVAGSAPTGSEPVGSTTTSAATSTTAATPAGFGAPAGAARPFTTPTTQPPATTTDPAARTHGDADDGARAPPRCPASRPRPRPRRRRPSPRRRSCARSTAARASSAPPAAPARRSSAATAPASSSPSRRAGRSSSDSAVPARRSGTPSPRSASTASRRCPSRQLAIVLDDVIQSAPVVRQPSFSGEVSITGNFDGGRGPLALPRPQPRRLPDRRRGAAGRHGVADARQGLDAGVDLRRARRRRSCCCSC